MDLIFSANAYFYKFLNIKILSILSYHENQFFVFLNLMIWIFFENKFFILMLNSEIIEIQNKKNLKNIK